MEQERSDLKGCNPDNFPEGFGPQGDAIRIYNFTQLVRTAYFFSSLTTIYHPKPPIR
jgi:hypothetical protein